MEEWQWECRSVSYSVEKMVLFMPSDIQRHVQVQLVVDHLWLI